MLIPLNVLVRVVRMKYNALRLYVISLISHHATFQSYCYEYQYFLNYVRRNWPHLVRLVENNNNERTLLVLGKRYYRKMHQKPRLKRRYKKIIYGRKSYHKYVAVKKVLKATLTYQRELNSYLKRIEKYILYLLKLMKQFREFYTQFMIMNMKESNAIEKRGDDEIILDSINNHNLHKIYENVNWQRITI